MISQDMSNATHFFGQEYKKKHGVLFNESYHEALWCLFVSILAVNVVKEI